MKYRVRAFFEAAGLIVIIALAVALGLALWIALTVALNAVATRLGAPSDISEPGCFVAAGVIVVAIAAGTIAAIVE